MPPGRGKKFVRSTFSAADYALLKVEASQRRTSVNELVHSSINAWLNPEKRERGILLTNMETLSDHLSQLVPELHALSQATARTEGLSRALDTLRGDQQRAQDHTTKTIQALTDGLNALSEARWHRQLRQYGVGAAMVLFGAAVAYLSMPIWGGVLVMFGLLVVALP